MRPEDLKCEPCGRTFSAFKFYMTHFVRSHNTMPPCYEGRKTFKCEIEECGYMFLKQTRLDHHMKTVRVCERMSYEIFEKMIQICRCLQISPIDLDTLMLWYFAKRHWITKIYDLIHKSNDK